MISGDCLHTGAARTAVARLGNHAAAAAAAAAATAIAAAAAASASTAAVVAAAAADAQIPSSRLKGSSSSVWVTDQ